MFPLLGIYWDMSPKKKPSMRKAHQRLFCVMVKNSPNDRCMTALAIYGPLLDNINLIFTSHRRPKLADLISSNGFPWTDALVHLGMGLISEMTIYNTKLFTQCLSKSTLTLWLTPERTNVTKKCHGGLNALRIHCFTRCYLYLEHKKHKT